MSNHLRWKRPATLALTGLIVAGTAAPAFATDAPQVDRGTRQAQDAPATSNAPQVDRGTRTLRDTPTVQRRMRVVAEKPTIVQGTLARVSVVPTRGAAPASHDEHEKVYVVSPDRTVEVPAHMVEGVEAGSVVRAEIASAVSGGSLLERRVRQIQVKQVVVVTPPPVTPPVAGQTRHVTIVQVDAGKRDGTTPDQLRAAVASADSYWRTETDGKTGFVVDKVIPWVTTSASCSDFGGVTQDIMQKTGYQGGPGQHLVMYAPADSCPLGLGSVGDYASYGGILTVDSTRTDVLSHELGHNLGLDHSGTALCSTTQDYSSSMNGCRTDDYGNLYELMGYSWGVRPSISGYSRSVLGLSTSADTVELTPGSRTITLSPVGGHQGLRFAKATTSSGTYWIEYRTPTGSDTEAVSKLTAGVLVYRVDRDGSIARVLDASPSSDPFDEKWTVGQGATFTSTDGALSVKVNLATSSAVLQATVR